MMKQVQIHTHPSVTAKFDSFPSEVKEKLQTLRTLIIETATELESILEIEETLKWGEPSYLTKKGSTIRISWSPKTPPQYGMYFTCSTNLVDTFKAVFGDVFRYENNRAILFNFDDPIPQKELKECIEMALTYHTIKHMPLLGK